MRFFPNKKEASLFIATLILVGFAVSVTVAVAYCIGTIAATQLEAKDAAIIFVTVVASFVMLFIARKTTAYPTKTNT